MRLIGFWKRRSAHKRRAKREHYLRWGGATPFLYLAPAFLTLTLFVYWPVLQSIHLSFHDWNLIKAEGRFVGLENYLSLLSDPFYYRLLWQSGLYTLLALVGNFLFPVALALLTLQFSRKEADIYQAILFTPTVVAASVASLIWMWFYLPAGGPLSAILKSLGLPPVGLLSNPDWALPAVAVVSNWKFLGFHYLIALAGLKAIPKDYLEAAQIDGASGFRLLRWVLLPLFSPTALYLFLSTLIQALESAFIPIEILTLGGPDGATSNLLYQVYLDGFRFFRVGIASAQSVLLLLLMSGFVFWQLRLMEQRVHYEKW